MLQARQRRLFSGNMPAMLFIRVLDLNALFSVFRELYFPNFCRVIHSVVAKFETKDAFHFEGDSVSVPDSKLEKVNGGVPMFSDENYPPIAPLPAYPESPALNEAAMRFLREHYEKFVMRSRESTRILKQKHSLLAIPVTTVDLVYKGKQYKLWVYGTERSIHCPAMESCSIL